MLVTAFLVVGVVSLVIWWYSDRRKQFRVFKNNGIPGPEPNIFLGNVQDMSNFGFHEMLARWSKQYGPTYGYFQGPRPVLVTSDVELLKQIMVKHFGKFNYRKIHPLQDPKDKYKHLLNAEGSQWKRLRTITSPTFSGRRMKEMAPLIHTAIVEFMDVLETRATEAKSFDIHSEFQRLTLTVIASCAFGIDVNALKDVDSPFLFHARKFFAMTAGTGTTLRGRLVGFISTIFPAFLTMYTYVRPYTVTPRTWFLETAAKILKSRMESRSERVDFVQLMLDARETEVEGDLTMTEDDNEEGENTKAQKVNGADSPSEDSAGRSKGLTMEEMQGQSMVFLLAGYETTSTALGLTAYILATHPEIQRKLQTEIDDHFPAHGPRPEYETVRKMSYLDMVISEVLRMYPIAVIAATRETMEDFEFEGRTIPKGMKIQTNMAAIHYNPELWGPEDPQLFVPERFLPERKQSRHVMAWVPFGAGPRNCAGMRFALLETKLVLVCLLQRYTIERCPETKVPLPLQKNFIRSPSEGVFVRLKKHER